MATAVPAKLKAADIQRFAKRAAQLEKYRPIVAYWCEYFILQQILSKQLHIADDECSNYAIQLMDKLERTKVENTANDAIVDDVAAKAYMENFALETFDRADAAQRGNKVTVQTADTFQAASTFMDVLSIWPDIDDEILAKAKFARFHAVRILKAIKAGKDPNESNPAVSKPHEPANDDFDAEANALGKEEEESASDRVQAEDIESGQCKEQAGDNERALPDSILHSNPFFPMKLPKSTNEPENTSRPRSSSGEGEYVPAVPSRSSAPGHDFPHPTYAASVDPRPPELPYLPQETTKSPISLNMTAQPPPPATSLGQPQISTPVQMTAKSLAISSISSTGANVSSPTLSPLQPAATALTEPTVGYSTDDESIMAAQKHAKWAISALNFEDVNTAVKELRQALHTLGATRR